MVEWTTVRSAGHVAEIKSPPDARGIRLMKPFLMEVIKEFARENERFHKATNELPIIYSERSLQHILATAISSAGGLPFAEQPVQRRWNGDARLSAPHRGALDIWALHGKNVYCIEAKHGWSGYGCDKVKAWVSKAWADAVSKADEITPLSIQDMRYGTRGAVLTWP